jgi:ankyrin repeat protein
MGIDWRPIHAAVYSESQKLVELLVENGADINVKNKEVANFTPLHIAISIEEPPLQLVNYLLKRGANLNIPDENGEVNYPECFFCSQRNAWATEEIDLLII